MTTVLLSVKSVNAVTKRHFVGFFKQAPLKHSSVNFLEIDAILGGRSIIVVIVDNLMPRGEIVPCSSKNVPNCPHHFFLD